MTTNPNPDPRRIPTDLPDMSPDEEIALLRLTLAAAEEGRAELRAENARLRAVVARLAQMADHWEQKLPEVIRTPAVVSAIRAALEPAVSVVPPATNQTALRDRIADAIRDAACPGECGKTEEECARERIQPFAWHHGRLAVVEGEPEMFADAVLAVLPAPVDRAAVLREAADRLVDEIQCGARFGHEDARQPGLAEAVMLLRRWAEQPADASCVAAEAPHAETPDAPAVVAQPGKETAAEDPPVVAYRSDGGRLLNCLRHVPPPAARHADFHPVTSEDLPDGGICTYSDCGVDVLIATAPAVSSRPSTEQGA